MKRALAMLGLSARAGKVVSGEKQCVQAIRRGSVYAALIDEGASQNARKALENACRTRGITLLTAPGGALGKAIGKEARMVAAVTDQGLAQRIIELAGMD